MPGAYQAARAHEQAKHLAARPKGLKIEDPQLRSFVVAKLNEHWPPCQIELPPVSWTSKLKSREWEAFRACGCMCEA